MVTSQDSNKKNIYLCLNDLLDGVHVALLSGVHERRDASPGTGACLLPTASYVVTSGRSDCRLLTYGETASHRAAPRRNRRCLRRPFGGGADSTGIFVPEKKGYKEWN